MGFDRLTGGYHVVKSGLYAENQPLSVDVVRKLTHNQELLSDGYRPRHLVNEAMTGEMYYPIELSTGTDGQMLRSWPRLPVYDGLTIDFTANIKITTSGGGASTGALYAFASGDLLSLPWTDNRTSHERHLERFRGTRAIDSVTADDSFDDYTLSVRPLPSVQWVYLSLWVVASNDDDYVYLANLSAVEKVA